VSVRTAPDARERILDAACDVIARHGIEDVRIARIATRARVSPALVHYHFETREALLAEALEHSFELLGDLRTTAADAEGWTAAERLAWMIDQSLPFPGMGDREWGLWLELWGRAARRPELRAIAARLYARYDAWFAGVVRDGAAAGEFEVEDIETAVQELVASIDGLGLRVLVDDPAMSAGRARTLVLRGLARALGVGEEAFATRGGRDAEA
jgi:AcrR family transcriptional regulator